MSLNVLQEKIRADKFLSTKNKDISRGEITRLINKVIIKARKSH